RLVAAGRVSRPEPRAAGLLLVQDQEDLARSEHALDRREHLGQRLRQLSTKPGLPEDERDRPRLDAAALLVLRQIPDGRARRADRNRAQQEGVQLEFDSRRDYAGPDEDRLET